MPLRPRIRSCFLFLICATFLVARLSGVHLHLCLDGSEPFASVHMLDAGEVEPGAGVAATHHDEEIFPIGDALSKSKVGLDLLVLATFALLLWALLQLPRLFPPVFRPLLAAADLRVSLPPSRAPPR